eukprot:GGOE01030128.1.p4 GENE.GGOE01030128.1~~GGOE01030128.1.p4  ORF type:complete len:128 (-),score=2.63 GGOE01030128.1:296-679(-)
MDGWAGSASHHREADHSGIWGPGLQRRGGGHALRVDPSARGSTQPHNSRTAAQGLRNRLQSGAVGCMKELGEACASSPQHSRQPPVNIAEVGNEWGATSPSLEEGASAQAHKPGACGTQSGCKHRAA